MFDAPGFAMTGDHLDLSFEQPEGWTKVGPGEFMPPSLFVKLGDPKDGPCLQLVACPPAPVDSWIDTHYHASDQFRLILQGRIKVQVREMTGGSFGYQVAGVPYREGMPGGGEEIIWMFAAHGTWRGARSTTMRQDGSWEFGEIAEDQLDRPVEAVTDPYWSDVAGGAKGVAAVASTVGPVRGGFNWGAFDGENGWSRWSDGVEATVGLFGPAEAGPVAVTLRAKPGAAVLPPECWSTEVVVLVARGSARIGDEDYVRGSLRIQAANASLGAVVAGPEGADVVLMVADRRAIATASATRALIAAQVDQLRDQLAQAA